MDTRQDVVVFPQLKCLRPKMCYVLLKCSTYGLFKKQYEDMIFRLDIVRLHLEAIHSSSKQNNRINANRIMKIIYFIVDKLDGLYFSRMILLCILLQTFF